MKAFINITFWIVFVTTIASSIGPIEAQSGTTYVKIKRGEVVFKKQIPPVEVQQYIAYRLKDERKGYYEVKYEMGQSDTSLGTLEKKKVDTPAGIVLKTAGGLLFIAIGLVALFR